MSKTTPRTFPIIPTLDLVTPMMQKKPGVLIASMNHEPMADGAHRIDGLERVDGQTKPSLATYYYLTFTTGTATIVTGATVTGATSGATGKMLVDMVVSSGTFGASNAVGYLVLTSVTGTFQSGENLQVTAVTKCVSSAAAVLEGADNDTDDMTWKHLAIETQRALIGKIPGEGNVLGAWMLGGVMFGFRNAVGGATAAMYKSTTAGWSLVPLGFELAYTSGGTYQIAVGDVITGASSGATATVTGITMTASEDVTTGNATGYIFFASKTGNFTAENLNVGGHLNVATIAANATALTLAPGGRYEFLLHNFFGNSTGKRLYGVNGVGPAFCFDGTTFMFLHSPITSDVPDHIAEQEEHLILSFPGGTVINSGDGLPDNYTAAFGAAQFGLGDDCTGMVGPYSNALFIAARGHLKTLLGHDSSDFQLVPASMNSGAIEWTLQMFDKPLFFDDAGLRSATQGQVYGDYNVGTLSRMIEPYLLGKKRDGISPVASVIVKRKSQYRVFFDDNSVLSFYFGAVSTNPITGQTTLPWVLPQDLGLLCTYVASCEDASGNEVLLFGSADGYLYQLDSGTSLDGGQVEAYLRPTFDHCGSPDYIKQFDRLGVEGTFADNATVYYSAEMSYADPNSPPSAERSSEIAGNGGFWTQTSNWNEFNWSAAAVGKIRNKLYGRGENVSAAITTTLTYERPYTISGMAYHYRLLRPSRMVA